MGCMCAYDLIFYGVAFFVLQWIAHSVYLKVKFWQIAKKKKATAHRHMQEVGEKLKDFKLSEEVEHGLRSYTISDIHEKLLLPGKVTCVDMVKFYTCAAYRDCYHLNHAVDFLYKEAIELAEQRDRDLPKLKQGGKPLPLLFGIPMSLKDVFEFKGHDTTMGAAYHCFKPDKEHGALVDMMLKEGAIPFVKTNVPQLLLINESNNWIFGRSLNPWDTDRSTGGSSGGEAGLIAMGASPLGLGSDGGGSVRIPANHCGIYGVRPTTKRFTVKGHKMVSSYVPRHVFGSVGPLAKSIDDCGRCLEAMQNLEIMRKADPLLPVIPWNRSIVEEYATKKLRVGVIYEFDKVDLRHSDLQNWTFSEESYR